LLNLSFTFFDGNRKHVVLTHSLNIAATDTLQFCSFEVAAALFKPILSGATANAGFIQTVWSLVNETCDL